MTDDEKRKADLEKRLEALGPKPDPAPAPQAMCYAKAAEPRTVGFSCRVCGGRTEYPRLFMFPPRLDLPSVPGWELGVDEREFCRACTPVAPQPPRAVLVAKRDGNETRTRGFTDADLDALRGWVARRKSCLGRLLPVPRRVREILGL